MYQKSFYITDCVGNNTFCFHEVSEPKLFVPSLLKGNQYQPTLGREIAFRDRDFSGILQLKTGLENFYQYDWNGIPLYLFDNHNHAFYFWYRAYFDGIISENSILYHVDEHADMRAPDILFPKKDAKNLQKVFEYTNFVLNVGNYIVPALENGLFSEVVQIRSEENIRAYEKHPSWWWNIVLNLDVDFFEPELDYIDYESKKRVILDIARKSKLITVCTSPFFIDQKLALEVFGDIFFEIYIQ